MYGTLTDLRTWASTIGHGRNLSNDAFVARLTQISPVTPDRPIPFGLGINIASLPTGSVIYHTGQVRLRGPLRLLPRLGSDPGFPHQQRRHTAPGATDPTNTLFGAVNPLILDAR